MRSVNDYSAVPEDWLLGNDGDITDWSQPSTAMPLEFDPKKARLFLTYMQYGMTERQACLEVPMMESLVRSWKSGARATPASFIRAYARAREIQIHRMADDVVDIADGTDLLSSKHVSEEVKSIKNPFRAGISKRVEEAVAELVAKSGNRMAARKWYVSKILPQHYGDKHELVHTSPTNKPVEIDIKKLTTEQLEALAKLDAELTGGQ